ncbi:type II secretion system protein [Cerasicoccus arenae]|uniref:Type II secretion system protein n=1 Tax=Cerasicoccus arenae TaxID=424488 RepID=A0A8J3DAD7_9BACT|nr:prepilin-type N-terminal cleavage/methylation domain-containing protein [Cerasicoccus arenae]MBK1859031.1 prepilin-type N-terminal cleavage/methylation domain-containing protein [Cerasicoccus arenae]GHB94837.1 hypothetical protein GCM10007047_07970 [Cerasicoccus arenae]
MKSSSKHFGFTLIEVLVSVSIIGVLSAITVAAVGTVRESAYRSSDIAAARQLAAAYLLYPQDHNGKLLPSVPSDDDRQMTTVMDHRGNPIYQGAISDRYVFRLLPYSGGIDLFFPGRSQEHLAEIRDNDLYKISMYPSFGLNSSFVGGDYSTDGRHSVGKNPHYAITMMSQCIQPSDQIVFVSALSTPAQAETEAPYAGKFYVYGPNEWSGSYKEDTPKNMGNIHLRYANQAVVAHLDGSVALLNSEELKDMRRWSNQARDRNDPNFKPR